MGIRYEKDDRKATNGPLIFFSVIKDQTFEEEIRSAYLSGLSFYAYRFPEDSMLTFGSSESYMEGIGEPGFVVGLFSPELPFLTIPYKGKKSAENPRRLFEMPSRSTTFAEYDDEVTGIIKSILEGKATKIVAARVIVSNSDWDIAEKFYELCERLPDAFVFCFATPATGCWIGASPELLLKGSNGKLETMALAGTREAGSDKQWDKKNLEEQQIVTDYILDAFRKYGLNPELQESYTKQTGFIEHICTPIIGTIHNDYNSKGDVFPIRLEKLLRDLSPTPALCGQSKEFALKEIKHLEKFDRGCYGGFCGPYHSIDDFSFNVILRCAAFDQKQICIYVGGGITKDSNVVSEWEETRLKAENTFPS